MTTMNYPDVLKFLELAANETVWFPAQIKNGLIENATQAYVEVKGARKGESNFKKQQKPAHEGEYVDESSLGIYVMNQHTEKTILDTKEIDIDARMLRLGKTTKVMYARMGWDDIFARAALKAIEILERSQLLNNTQAGAMADGAVNGRITQNP